MATASIEERISKSLRIIRALTWALQSQGDKPDTDQLFGMGEILEAVTDDLEPIRTAPFAVLAWAPPHTEARS